MNPILFCKSVKRRNASEFKRITHDIQQSALKVRKKEPTARTQVVDQLTEKLWKV